MTDAVHVEADADAFGPTDVAREIAAVVTSRRRRARHTSWCCWERRRRHGDFQVGVRLAYALGWPVVTGIQNVSIDGDEAVLRGEGQTGRDLSVALPAVVTILEGGVEPRIRRSWADEGQKAPVGWCRRRPPGGFGGQALTVPPPPPNQVQDPRDGPAAGPAFVETLVELGVIR